MRQMMSLAWKEWREVQAFFWIALFVFVGLPVIAAIEAIFQRYSHGFELLTSQWVLTFGGVLAVFIAVGITCRDFQGHLEDFWRSRPLGVAQWLLVKYSVGLAVVLTACVLPLVLELETNPDSWLGTSAVIWNPFLWTALFSIGFLAGCLVRRTAQAAMLGLAAMLLVYFLPVVLPPLAWLDSTSVANTGYRGLPFLLSWWDVAYGAGMLGIAATALALAVVAVRRGWRIDAGRKTMYGSISTAILILFASAGFQLGTNLPILQQVDLSAEENVTWLHLSGTSGWVVSRKKIYPTHGEADGALAQYIHRTFELTPSGIQLGDANAPTKPQLSPLAHPDVEYVAIEKRDEHYDVSCSLYVRDVRQVYSAKAAVVVPLWKGDNGYGPQSVITHVVGDRLYVMGKYLAILNISQPLAPKLISLEPFPFVYGGSFNGSDRVKVILPPVPGLPPQMRLEAVLKQASFNGLSWSESSFDGTINCVYWQGTLYAYRLTNLTDKTARFEKIGEYRQTMLEQTFSTYYPHSLAIENGLLYVTCAVGRGLFNGSISVFDLRGSRPLRLVGHFAAPGVTEVWPLPDGRALVGGSKIWLVGPPRRDAE